MENVRLQFEELEVNLSPGGDDDGGNNEGNDGGNDGSDDPG